jgi:hypothetical protein
MIINKNDKELIFEIRDYMKNMMEMTPEQRKMSLFPDRFRTKTPERKLHNNYIVRRSS